MAFRIFLPKMSPAAHYKLMMDAYSHGCVTGCVSIERLKQPRNLYYPMTIYTLQTQSFAPFHIFDATHMLVREQGHYRIYNIPTQYLLPYKLANYASRRVEHNVFLNLPADVRVGDQIFVGRVTHGWDPKKLT